MNRTSKMSKVVNFTECIKNTLLMMNGTNITGSIGPAAKELVDPEGMLASMAISIIFMLILVIVVIALIVLMDPPGNPSARERRQNNIRFEGDMEMHRMGNSPQEKSQVPMEGGECNESAIRT